MTSFLISFFMCSRTCPIKFASKTGYKIFWIMPFPKLTPYSRFLVIPLVYFKPIHTSLQQAMITHMNANKFTHITSELSCSLVSLLTACLSLRCFWYSFITSIESYILISALSYWNLKTEKEPMNLFLQKIISYPF